MNESKGLLRIVWIVEAGLLFAASFAILMIWADRMGGLIELMPYLFGLIVLQATGAIGGSNFKRLTEGFKARAVGPEKKSRGR